MVIPLMGCVENAKDPLFGTDNYNNESFIAYDNRKEFLSGILEIVHFVMTIEYLKKLQATPKIGIREMKGVSGDEIKKVEQKFNIQFPLAYSEFLFLAGESCGALPIMDTSDLATISSDWHYEIMQDEIKETELNNILIRPFWLFAESNGCEQFYFFYLDEGNDPTVYLVDYSATDYNKKDVKSLKVNFSTFIEKKIDTAFKIWEEGW